MKTTATFSILSLLLCWTFLTSFAPVSRPAKKAAESWEFLGVRLVNFTVDRDEIPVTWRDGHFDAIKIFVKRGAVNMHKVIIHFENGGVQDVELRHNFGPGSQSRIIDLPGNNRFIEKIVFVYDTKNFSGRRATVQVWGRH